MNIKRFIIATIVIFIVYSGLDYVVKSILMAADFTELTAIWRQNVLSYVWMTYIAKFIIAVLFVYIYSVGCESKGVLEGLRYGAAIGILLSVPSSIGQYVLYPISTTFAAKLGFFGIIEFVLLGILVYYLYKPKSTLEKFREAYKG